MSVIVMLGLTALSATLEVVIEGFVGMAMTRIGVLDEKGAKVLTNLGYYVTLPCMNIYRLASGVDIEMIKTVWIVSVYSFFYIVLSNVLSRLVFLRRIWRGRIKDEIQHTMYIFSVTFNNAVSIPFVFVGALVLSGSSIFTNPQQQVSKAVAFISIYSIANNISFWTYGFAKMKSLVPVQVPIEEIEEISGKTEEGLVDPQVQLQDVQVESPTSSPTEEEPEPRIGYMQNIFNKLKNGIKSMLTPPLISMIAGIIIACITPLKNFLVTNPPVIVSSLMHVASLFGDAAFALSMLVLGSNLYTTFMSDKIADDNDKERRPRSGFSKYACFICDKMIKHNDPLALFFCLILKLVVVPLIGIGVIVGSVYAGILPRTDSVLLLVLLVEASTPSAINLNNMTNLCNGIGQKQICEILLFMYACAPISLSILATIYLYLIEYLATTAQ
ncbi:10 TM domain-containing transmembrane protein [Acrasis kona]|uniref:10 TM domain-containing transmembrane protein n=1 Tax=Acrasis kona TaxID=1008807 RepID=A0AAW2ZAF4_9EUKA